MQDSNKLYFWDFYVFMAVLGSEKVSIGFPDPVGSILAEYGPARTHGDALYAQNRDFCNSWDIWIVETWDMYTVDIWDMLTVAIWDILPVDIWDMLTIEMWEQLSAGI